MRIFTSNDFETGYWTGTAAVIVAENYEAAYLALVESLGCWPHPRRRNKVIHSNFTLQELDVSKAQVVILQDGDY